VEFLTSKAKEVTSVLVWPDCWTKVNPVNSKPGIQVPLLNGFPWQDLEAGTKKVGLPAWSAEEGTRVRVLHDCLAKVNHAEEAARVRVLPDCLTKVTDEKLRSGIQFNGFQGKTPCKEAGTTAEDGQEVQIPSCLFRMDGSRW